MRMKSKIDWNNISLFTKNSTKLMKEKRIYMAVSIKWNTKLPKYVMYPSKIGHMKAVSEKKIFQEKKKKD